MNGIDREVRFEILEHIGVLRQHNTGWNKEINLVSWNGGQPKYDIRDWSEDHNYMSRGITLSEGEMRKLIEHLYVRRKTKRPLQERIAEAGENQEQQPQEAQKGRAEER